MAIIGVNYIKVKGINFTNNPSNGINFGVGININSTGSIISNANVSSFHNGIQVSGSSVLIEKSGMWHNSIGLIEYESMFHAHS